MLPNVTLHALLLLLCFAGHHQFVHLDAVAHWFGEQQQLSWLHVQMIVDWACCRCLGWQCLGWCWQSSTLTLTAVWTWANVYGSLASGLHQTTTTNVLLRDWDVDQMPLGWDSSLESAV